MANKTILDCDPGHDDAIALILAHGNPEIELVAVTTVHGNRAIEKVTRKASSIHRFTTPVRPRSPTTTTRFYYHPPVSTGQW